ncbi:cysteine synthase A [Buchnera aphidicola (Thelaxes californica)]|uniref:Cysteine synthase n=1 Tax=Buchnera aphidicola (Thelaxes californica) TaxID=1315998 RepID=A0A4D6YJF9_9GAMM|nr:cysteine synthase A [Buchnera aphidicola]QCI26611.1 cysteine synthase A [Buchnera aphidicola (Thelaxes californica)]
MHKIYQDNSFTIGNTPLVQLNHIGEKKIFAKIESRNPSFSVKCRIGSNMIWEAEKTGLLTKKKILVEATSGNTGISLAYVAAARGYQLIITMPETMSNERKKLLIALGAHLKITEGKYGMRGAIEAAHTITQKNPHTHLMLKQFENPANPEIHKKTTGPEIWNDTNGEIDILVSGIGTGGTISGISQYIKLIQKKQNLISVGVEPIKSPVITQFLSGKKIRSQPHKIQGIGAGFIPKNLDLNILDRIITVSEEDSIKMAKILMKKEGILSGISSGAAVVAALQIQNERQFKNKKIIVILPSSGERYLSTELFQ